MKGLLNFVKVNFRPIVLYILFLILMSTSILSKAQNPCESDDLCVVQFNAGFNEANKVDWLPKLSDCSNAFIDIQKDATAAGKYKIVVVPTILIFKGEEEVSRFQANIMMQMEATKKDVQSSIDDILMEDF